MAQGDLVRELAAVIDSGHAVLFTGAGFSGEATDRSGRSLPDSREMVRDLWTILFGDPKPDDSSLADLYDVALQNFADNTARAAGFIAGAVVSPLLFLGAAILYEDQRARLG